MTYYLKINRKEPYTITNLKLWMDAISKSQNAVVFVLCDDDDLRNLVLEQTSCESVLSSIQYGKDQKIDKIVENLAEPRWANAARAHLTTFRHAEENGVGDFWNIDADDTCVCLSSGRVSELLKTVEDYSIKEKVDILSLDMWRTKTWNLHWSFGISYVSASKGWIDYIFTHSYDENSRDPMQPHNLDGFFSYLKKLDKRIETFYFENLRFIHYSNDFLRRPWASGFYHWKDGQLIMPILSECLLSPLGREIIPEEVIQFDIGITDEESREFMIMNCYPKERAELGWRTKEKVHKEGSRKI